jgi:hypothetical protein
MTTDRFDRFTDRDVAFIDLIPVLQEHIGNILIRHRSVQPTGGTGFRYPYETFSLYVSRYLTGALKTRLLLFDLCAPFHLDDVQVVFRYGYRKLALEKVIVRIAGLDLNDVSGTTESFDTFQKYYFHAFLLRYVSELHDTLKVSDYDGVIKIAPIKKASASHIDEAEAAVRR